MRDLERARPFVVALLALAAVPLALLACGDAGTGSTGGETCTSTRLFGRPNDKTGLDDTKCGPTCGCGDEVWEPAEWTPERLDALLGWTLVDPPAPLDADPYAAPPAAAPEGSVCGFVPVDAALRTYRLETFASDADAEAAGAIVTHADGCGLCSPLADLAVYARELDLTAPVRQCGVENFGDFEGNVTCLEALGFTHPCAQIWAYNTANTRNQCLTICSALIDAPYHEPDGTLNECLLCDEEKSGPVFKAVAGRTRRNTGVANALCRPCSEVKHLDHAYDAP